MSCDCTETHTPKRVVLTGGPGAGKTAVLELVGHFFCHHVKVLPEAAGIVFGGGFPRDGDPALRRAAQRAIFHVQRELEEVGAAGNPAIVLCDRGTVDGIAFWPPATDSREASAADLMRAVGTTLEEQLARYELVIHLRTPHVAGAYNRDNPLRIETAAEALDADERILRAWAAHPNRVVVEPTPDFLLKASRTIAVLRSALPPCCEHHAVSLPESARIL